MYNLTDINEIRAIISRYGFSFSKSLGQNFLTSSEICHNIAKAGVASPDTAVLEIGTGIGSLTQCLAEVSDRVVTTEIDKKLFPIIDETLKFYDNVTSVREDIMKQDIAAFVKKHLGSGKVAVCANLPYYITTPVILGLLESGVKWESITVMIQKEVADKICAPIGTRDAGAISCTVRYYGRAQKCFDVGKGYFYPSPKVDSAVIKITPDDEVSGRITEPSAYFKVVRCGFAQRRKSFVNSFSASSGVAKDRTFKMLSDLGIDENIRAEKLTIDELIALAEYAEENNLFSK